MDNNEPLPSQENDLSAPAAPTSNTTGGASPEALKDYINSNYIAPPSTQGAAPTDVDPELEAFVGKEVRYGSTPQQIITGAEGAADAASFGASTGLEMAMGVNPQDIQGRREENPGSRMMGTLAGLGAMNLIPAVGEAADAREALTIAELAANAAKGTAAAEQATQGLEIARAVAENAINPINAQSIMSGAGRGLAETFGLSAKDAGFFNQLGAHTVQGATEMALLQGGDEVSKMLTNDPNQSVETALSNIGMSAAMGALGGGAIGVMSPLVKAVNGSEIRQFIEDFKGRINDHLGGLDEVGSFNKEMGSYIDNMNAHAEGVYGDNGLKGKAIQAFIPEYNNKMLAQANDLTVKADKELAKLGGDPLAHKLANRINSFKQEVTAAQSSPELFDAVEGMKKQLQEWGKYNKVLVPLAERDFRDAAKGLGFEFRTALESPEVWGKAGLAQKEINSAFSEYFPTLKDMNRRFTSEVGGERVFNPASGQTYINQLGNAKAEIKQQVLKNFLDAGENYKKAISNTYQKLGLENPYPEAVPMNNIMSTFNKRTAGMQAADEFVKKNLSNMTGKTAGALIGGGLGRMTGIPGAGWAGGWLGEKVLGRFLGSVMPSIAKPILKKATNAAGFATAADYGMNVMRGESALNKAAKGLFKAGPRVLGTYPADYKLDKLDEKLKELQVNSSPLISMGEDIGHYLPEHNTAIGQAIGTVITYLNELRPNKARQNPLDEEPPIDKIAEAKYREALTIAEAPLVVLEKLKDGTLTHEDLGHLNNMYPALYSRLRSKLNAEMTDALAEKKQIPYKMKLGLSMFMGQPMDGTMTQPAIQSIQTTFATGTPSQQASMTKGRGEKGSMKNINKLGAADFTPEQARASKRSQPTV